MIDPTIYDNFNDAADETPDVSALSDDAVVLGAAMGSPAHIREFLRREYGADKVKSEEQIRAEEEGLRSELQEREDQVDGFDPANLEIEEI